MFEKPPKNHKAAFFQSTIFRKCALQKRLYITLAKMIFFITPFAAVTRLNFSDKMLADFSFRPYGDLSIDWSE